MFFFIFTLFKTSSSSENNSFSSSWNSILQLNHNNLTRLNTSQDKQGSVNLVSSENHKLQQSTHLQVNVQEGNTGIKVKIYEWFTLSLIKKDLTEGIMSYNWKNYTLVRWKSIENAFNEMWTRIYDVKDWNQATVYLKYVFGEYKEQYSLVFKQTDRGSVSHQEMYNIIDQWIIDNKIPYISWQAINSDEIPLWWTSQLMFWLPLRINGNFVSVIMNQSDQQAYFYSDYNIDAAIAIDPMIK